VIAGGYVALFAVSFLAATIFPAQSELVLAGMLLSGAYDNALLLLVATIGNTAGACVNWLLGRFIHSFQSKRWFPFPERRLDRAEGWYRKWGKWSLLLSWAPVVGDALTLLAGVARVPLGTFVALVVVAKGGRYLVLAYSLTLALGRPLA
jgi:membrane protein YqaA with SNARE-associated domain